MTERNTWAVDWSDVEFYIPIIREAVDADSVPDETSEPEAYAQFMDVVT